jgi:hypothetical protein
MPPPRPRCPNGSGLPDPLIADLLDRVEPLTDVVTIQYPASRRRRFESCPRRGSGGVHTMAVRIRRQLRLPRDRRPSAAGRRPGEPVLDGGPARGPGLRRRPEGLLGSATRGPAVDPVDAVHGRQGAERGAPGARHSGAGLRSGSTHGRNVRVSGSSCTCPRRTETVALIGGHQTIFRSLMMSTSSGRPAPWPV